jgi:hypothetical protein
MPKDMLGGRQQEMPTTRAFTVSLRSSSCLAGFFATVECPIPAKFSPPKSKSRFAERTDTI